MSRRALPAAAADLGDIHDLGEGEWAHISAGSADLNLVVSFRYIPDGDDDGVDPDGAFYAEVVDNDMNIVVPEMELVSGPDVYSYEPPFAAWNEEAGNWLVTWADDEVVYGIIVDPETGPVATPTVLADANANSGPFEDIEQTVAAYSAASNAYLVAVKASSEAEYCQEIFGVLVDANGLPLEETATVLSSDDPGPDADSGCDLEANNGVGVAYAPSTDQWFVAWAETMTGTKQGRLVGVSGTTPETQSAVTTVGSSSTSGAPTVVYDSTGDRFLVSWFNNVSGGTEIVANFVTIEGVADPDDVFVVVAHDSALRRPRVAFDAAANSFLFVAHAEYGDEPDVGDDESGGQVYLWTLASGATGPLTGVLLNDDPLVPDGSRPAIAINENCALIVWGENLYDNDGDSVFGRALCSAVEEDPELAETGIDATGIALGGAVLLLFGAGLAAAVRRRSAASGR